jgi:hypothetical protein
MGRGALAGGWQSGLILAALLAAGGTGLLAEELPRPKFRLGKETTYVTGPLDQEGYIDYEAAINERLRQGIKPETNGNVLLWQAWGPRPQGRRLPERFYQLLEIADLPEQGEYFVGLGEYLQQTAKLDREAIIAAVDQFCQISQQAWSATDHPRFAGWLRANDKPLTLVIEATKRPQYCNPLVTTGREPGRLLHPWMPGVERSREVQLALVGRAQMRIQEGKWAEAWQDLLAAHRLARQIARGASSDELLVGISLEQVACAGHRGYLEDARLTAEQLRSFLQDVQALPPLPPCADKVDLLERLGYLDLIQTLDREGLPPEVSDMLTPEELKQLQGSTQILWETAMRTGNRWFDRIVAVLRLPNRAAREKALDEIDQELEALVRKTRPTRDQRVVSPPEKLSAQVGEYIGYLTVALLSPSIRKVQQAQDRATQIQRNVQVALALAIYQREHRRYPARLDELVPRYLPAVARDLFTDRPLIYRPTERGYVLYSVGVNGQDDEGRTYRDNPPGDDLVIRLPLPSPKRKDEK